MTDDPTDDSYTVASTLTYRIPFLILGIAIGMFTVWVALKWLPPAISAAKIAAGI